VLWGSLRRTLSSPPKTAIALPQFSKVNWLGQNPHVEVVGQQAERIMVHGRTNFLRTAALLMKYFRIAAALSTSAMTPSFIGRTTTMLPGVRPSTLFAYVPTAITRRPPRMPCSTATMLGSFETMPAPRT
jgi:hypothetical protein